MKRRFFGQNKKRRDTSKNYFTIEVLEDEIQIKLSNSYEYCVDDGFWNKATHITSINANAGQLIYFKGNLTPSGLMGIGNFIITKKCNLSGNIMSLLYGDEFEGQTDLSDTNSTFYSLFYDCDTIIDASQLKLPATTLANSCYQYMFNGCTSLITAPELPATTLTTGCYMSMFKNCTSLVAAPALPATTLTRWCYRGMFEDCTSLKVAPELPATTLAESCYYEMFRDCYSLVSAPELPATTLTTGCYDSMFQNCTKLNYIKALFTMTPGSTYTGNWVSGVSSTGTFVKNKYATWNVTGVNGIPSGWAVQTA